MARLIDATRIEQYILNNCADNEEINAIYGEIINAPTIEAEPYIEFCEWVADTVLYEDFEDKWTLGAFAEVACRKLYKLGFVRKDGEYWTKDEVEE